MSVLKLALILLVIFCSKSSFAQKDSSIQSLKNIPAKYSQIVNNKVQKYGKRISSKTLKTLTRLSKWERKIKELLERSSPATAQQLFGNNQLTFTALLEKIKKGEELALGYTQRYNDYFDKLQTNVRYLKRQKSSSDLPDTDILNKTESNINELDKELTNSNSVEHFIRDRRKQLIDGSIKYIGKSKYLQKINKESYYYIETLKNYDQIFSDPQKVEEIATKILSNIPGFQKFTQSNSQLAGMFGMPTAFPPMVGGNSMPIINGIATRASMQQYIQANVPSLNQVNIQQLVQSKLPDMSSPVDELRTKLSSKGDATNAGLPDFTPNNQKTKTFWQRVEYGFDLQFGKSISFLPATTNIGLKIGYKITDKSSAGIGITYLAGLGEGWNKIKITHQGLGVRSYLKWQIKPGLHIQGGGEMNYMSQFKKISELKQFSSWQQSALLGLNKAISAKKKLKGNIQLLFDFLYNQHIPASQPLVFRYGYNF